MARTPPTLPPPALSVLAGRRQSLFDLEIHVVTPLFGGGPKAGETDPDMPVRAAGIRGHLRFWWRACQGARFTSADALFAAEEALWGSTTVAGRVAVTVDILSKGRPRPAGEQTTKGFKATAGWPGYALFPFQGRDERGRTSGQPNQALLDTRFRLRLFSTEKDLDEEQLKQVRGALWAWLAFGGIGARTRRGCGSLFCEHPDFAPPTEPARLEAWLEEQGKTYIVRPISGGAPLPISLLRGARVLWGASSTPIESWNAAVGLMEGFRQVPEGRLKRQAVPGKSLWPEAESLRRVTNHEDSRTNSFPRADLGLPIVFQFKPSQKRQEPSKPMTLQPTGEKTTRMASPIILKPLTFGSNQAVPLAVCLAAPHVWDEPVLKAGISYEIKDGSAVPAEQLRVRRAAAIPPLANQGTADVREAFLRYAKKNLNEEVRF